MICCRNTRTDRPQRSEPSTIRTDLNDVAAHRSRVVRHESKRPPKSVTSGLLALASDGDPDRVLTQYVWGARPGHRDELILRDRATVGSGELDERLYCLMDYFDPTSAVDTEGEVVERYGFSAFGVREVMAADWSPRAESWIAWEFGFHGQFLDGETGYYNYGYRYYVPWLGRWVNRDPIGEEGGVNVYGFVRNNAILKHDLLGLIDWSDSSGNYLRIFGDITVGQTKSLNTSTDLHIPTCSYWEEGRGNRTDWGKWYQGILKPILKNITPVVNSFSVSIVDGVGITNDARYGGVIDRHINVERISQYEFKFIISWQATKPENWKKCKIDCTDGDCDCNEFTPLSKAGTESVTIEFK